MIEINKPMLANAVEEDKMSFNPKEYAIEPKYDGSRNLLILDFSSLYCDKWLTIKRRNSRTNVFEIVPNWQFPELNGDFFRGVLSADIKNVILDGEMVAKDFGMLMSRTHITDKLRIKIASKINPVSFIAFDVLALNDNDLTELPYSERRDILEKLITEENLTIKAIDSHITDKPFNLYRNLVGQGFEGIIAKRLESRYVQKRTDDWLKIKKHQTETLEILDFDTESNSRPQQNISIKVPVLNLITNMGRVTIPLIQDQEYFYAQKPKFVEVQFQELSVNGLMRFPVFMRFV